MSDRGTEAATRTAALRALAWVRATWPDARVTTTLIPSDDALISVRVEVSVSDGPAGAGHGAAPGVEEAEDRAILRAIETLGYEPEPVAPEVPERDPEPVQPPPLETVQHTPTTPLAGRSANLGPPVVMRPRNQPSPPPSRPTPVPEPVLREEPIDDREPEMEDVSWTAFWKWARAQGYDSGEAVARAIGRPIQGLSPREVRDLLRTRP